MGLTAQNRGLRLGDLRPNTTTEILRVAQNDTLAGKAFGGLGRLQRVTKKVVSSSKE